MRALGGQGGQTKAKNITALMGKDHPGIAPLWEWTNGAEDCSGVFKANHAKPGTHDRDVTDQEFRHCWGDGFSSCALSERASLGTNGGSQRHDPVTANVER